MNEELLTNEELLSLISTATALSTAATIVLAVVGLVLLICFFIVIPVIMAKKRERSIFGWLLIFLFFSPINGIIALLVLGDSKKKIRREILEEVQKMRLDKTCQM